MPQPVQRSQAPNLRSARRAGVLHLESIHAYNGLLARLDRALIVVRRALDLALHKTNLDRAQHAAKIVDLLYVVRGDSFDLACQVLDRVSSSHWIGGVRDSGLKS